MKQLQTRIIFLLLAFLFCQKTQAQNPVITTVISEVNLDSMLQTVRDISGENLITVNGVTDTLRSRNKLQPGNEVAFHYLMNRMSAYGLQIDSALFTYSGQTGRNIIVTQPGTLYPNQYYILCGHYDAMPIGTYGPAADDDGSGVATVLEAARILSQHEFEFTIVYAIWDMEEQGLRGSKAYANAAKAAGDSLLAVLNMDAIAYDSDNDGLARVHTKPIANSEALADTLIAINTNYNIGINLALNNPGATYSDHASFWNDTFSAVLLIEDFDDDPNIFYHTVADRVQYFNLPYYERLSELAIASIASLAVPYEAPTTALTETENDFSARCFPNPVSNTLTVLLGEVCSNAHVTVCDVLGQELLSQNFSDRKLLDIDMSAMSPGIYFTRIQADGKSTVAKVMRD